MNDWRVTARRLRREGLSVRKIAACLGRCKSSVDRALQIERKPAPKWQNPKVLAEIVRRWNALERVMDTSMAMGISEQALSRARDYAAAQGYALLTNCERRERQRANGAQVFGGLNASGVDRIKMAEVTVKLSSGVVATVRSQDKVDAKRFAALLNEPSANIENLPAEPDRRPTIAERFALVSSL